MAKKIKDDAAAAKAPAPKAATKAPAPKAAAKAPAPKADVTFFTWLQGARARAPLAEIITTLKADKKITETSLLKNVAKRYEGTAGFDDVVRRYELFAKRGSQAGMRSRKAA